MGGRDMNRYLTVTELADVAEVHPMTVRRHLAAGRLRGRKVGRDWMINERDAANWAAEYVPYDALRRRRDT
jgi:excisionase family DNA binding protein